MNWRKYVTLKILQFLGNFTVNICILCFYLLIYNRDFVLRDETNDSLYASFENLEILPVYELAGLSSGKYKLKCSLKVTTALGYDSEALNFTGF